MSEGSNYEFTKGEFLGLTWGLFAIPVVFLTARLLIRIKLYGRLMLDDALVILALVAVLIVNILETVFVDVMLEFQAVQKDHKKPGPDFEQTALTFAHYQWAVAYVYFTAIWAVKGSFLAFYDKLTQRLKWFRRAWWATIVITVLTYIGSLIAYGVLDGNKFATNFKNEAIRYQFSVDLATDIFITAIPLSLAISSQIPWKQKLALSGIFSMTLIVTIFAIVRFSLNNPSSPPTGPSWIQVWSSVEVCTSIAIASAASFRTFVLQRQEASAKASGGRIDDSYNSGRKQQSGFSQLQSFGSKSGRRDVSTESMDLELLDTSKADQTVTQSAVDYEHPQPEY